MCLLLAPWKISSTNDTARSKHTKRTRSQNVIPLLQISIRFTWDVLAGDVRCRRRLVIWCSCMYSFGFWCFDSNVCDGFWCTCHSNLSNGWTELHVAILNWLLIAERVCVWVSGDFLESAGFARVKGRENAEFHTIQFHGDRSVKRGQNVNSSKLFDAILCDQYQMLHYMLGRNLLNRKRPNRVKWIYKAPERGRERERQTFTNWHRGIYAMQVCTY